MLGAGALALAVERARPETLAIGRRHHRPGAPTALRLTLGQRRQVGERNVAASRFAAMGRRKWRAMYRPDIRDNTPQGAATMAVGLHRVGGDRIYADLAFVSRGAQDLLHEQGQDEKPIEPEAMASRVTLPKLSLSLGKKKMSLEA